MNIRYLLPSALMFSAAALAAPLKGIHVQDQDWEAACDNTGTCRVVGYHAKTETANPVSLLLLRKAGTHELAGALRLRNRAGDIPLSAELLLDGQSMGSLNLNQSATKEGGDYTLTAEQAQMLAAAIKENRQITLRSGDTVFTLSNAGAAAVWRRVDEFQRFGRLKPQTLPVLRKAPTVSASLYATAAQQRQILTLLRTRLNRNTCPALYDPAESELVQIRRLNSGSILANTACRRLADHGSDVYALLNPSYTGIRQLITTDGVDYHQGEIYTARRGQGAGGCVAMGTHTWNGRRFVRTFAVSSGMCRSFSGGAWGLPTLVYEVR